MNQQNISDELGRSICRIRDAAVGEGCALTKGVNLSSLEARVGFATHAYSAAARIVRQQVVDTTIFHTLLAADDGEMNVKFGSLVSGFIELNAGVLQEIPGAYMMANGWIEQFSQQRWIDEYSDLRTPEDTPVPIRNPEFAMWLVHEIRDRAIMIADAESTIDRQLGRNWHHAFEMHTVDRFMQIVCCDCVDLTIELMLDAMLDGRLQYVSNAGLEVQGNREAGTPSLAELFLREWRFRFSEHPVHYQIVMRRPMTN